MSEYRNIHTKIWKDEWFSTLAAEERLLFIYLFSNERASVCGLYELPMKFIAFESGLDEPTVAHIFDRFEADGKVYYGDGVVWVVNLESYNSMGDSIKVQIRAQKDREAVHDCIVKRMYYARHGFPYRSKNTLSEIPDTLSENGLRNIKETETDTDTETDTETETDTCVDGGEWLPEFSESSPDQLKSNSGETQEQVDCKSAPINTGNGTDHAFLEKVTLLFSEKFPNQPSVLRTLDLRDKYGPEKVMEALTWYAERDIPLTDALLRARRALPTWRSGKTSEPHPKKTVQPSPEDLLAELEGVPHV